MGSLWAGFNRHNPSFEPLHRNSIKIWHALVSFQVIFRSFRPLAPYNCELNLQVFLDWLRALNLQVKQLPWLSNFWFGRSFLWVFQQVGSIPVWAFLSTLPQTCLALLLFESRIGLELEQGSLYCSYLQSNISGLSNFTCGVFRISKPCLELDNAFCARL